MPEPKAACDLIDFEEMQYMLDEGRFLDAAWIAEHPSMLEKAIEIYEGNCDLERAAELAEKIGKNERARELLEKALKTLLEINHIPRALDIAKKLGKTDLAKQLADKLLDKHSSRGGCDCRL